MRNIAFGLCIIGCLTTSVNANDDTDPGGTLNPEELTLNSTIQRALNGDVDMMVCAQGYVLTKKGDHKDARTIFENCIKEGYTAAMTWMSYMEQNGFGDDHDSAASAEWDRKAAALGDPIGEFNYGLNLLRGYGVEQNEELGKTLVDRAAKNGVKAAKQLQDAGYDYRAVTPDADEWKFEKKLY